MEIGATEIFKRGLDFLQTGLARDVLGHLGQPLFYSIKKRHEEKKRNPQAAQEQDRNIFMRILTTIKDNIFCGDLYTAISGSVLLGNHYFGKGSESAVHKWINRIGWTVLFGGVLLARCARKLKLHIPYALGDAAASELLEEIQKELNTQIFDRIDEKVKSSHARLGKVLCYSNAVASDLRKVIFEGGFITGVPGVGKTVGVNYYLGEWLKMMENEGRAPEVHMLKLTDFTSGLQKIKEKERRTLEDLAKLHSAAGVISSLMERDAITALKLLIAKCEEVKTSVESRNKESGDDKVCARIFVDDIDKACELAELSGAEQQELVSLFGRLNDLLDDPTKSSRGKNCKLVITSNLSVEGIRKKLEKILPSNVLEAFLSRLSTNSVTIAEPDIPEQAKIASNYILTDYKDLIDYKSFGLDQNNVNNVTFAKAILDHPEIMLQNLGPKNITPRHLEAAINGLRHEIFTQAKSSLETKKSHDELSSMSEEEMIKQSGIKITPSMLFQVIQRQYYESYLKSLPQDEINSPQYRAQTILHNFIGLKKDEIQKCVESNSGLLQKPSVWQVIESVYDKEEDTGATIYKPKKKEKVVVDNVSYDHEIIIEKSGKEPIIFVKYDALGRNERIWIGKDFRQKEFNDFLARELAFATGGNALTKFIDGILKGFTSEDAMNAALAMLAAAK